MKEFLIVYQDCMVCGANKKWGDKTIEHLTKAGVNWRKVSFASQEGQAHAMKAIESGIESYPFVTDGEKYTKDIEDLFETKVATVKITKKTAKKAKGKKNGVDSKNN